MSSGGNGDEDLFVRFRAEDTGFAGDDFAARLAGKTIHGTPFSDYDFVMTVSGDDTGNDGSEDESDESDNSGDGNSGSDSGDGDGSGENSDDGGDSDG